MPRYNNSDRRLIRKAEAVKRQTASDTRSSAEQLKLLDERLGKGVGAEKERARLRGAQ